MNKICHNCGSTTYETARFCNQCGEKLQTSRSSNSGQSSSRQHQQSNEPRPTQRVEVRPTWQQASGEQQAWQQPVTPVRQSQSSELSPNVMALLSYPLSVLSGVIVLVLRPYNSHPLVRFHAYQSIYLFFTLVLLNIIVSLLSFMLPSSIEMLMSTGLRLMGIGGTGWLMYKAWLGIQFKLPVIGDLAENQALKQ